MTSKFVGQRWKRHRRRGVGTGGEEFISPQAKIYPHDKTTISILLSDILMIYLIFQQVTEDSVLSRKLSAILKVSELNKYIKTLKLTIKFVFRG